jgi:hypothetical protein
VQAKLRDFLLSHDDDDDDVHELDNVVARGWLPHYSRFKRDLKKKKKPEDLTEEECKFLEVMTKMEEDVRISRKWIRHNLPSFAEDCFEWIGVRETADGETHEERQVDMRMVDSSIERVLIVYQTSSNDDITKAIFEKDRRSEDAALTKAHNEYLARIKVRPCCRPIPTTRGTLDFFSPIFYSKTQVREGIDNGTLRNMNDIHKRNLQGPFDGCFSRLSILEEKKTILFRRKARLVAAKLGFRNELAVLTCEELVLTLTNKEATRLFEDRHVDDVLNNLENCSVSFAQIPAIAAIFLSTEFPGGFPKKKMSFVDFLNNEATEDFTDDGDMRFLKKLHHVRRACLLDPGWAKHNLPFVEKIVAHDGRASKTELYRNPAPSLVYNIALGEVYTHTAEEEEEELPLSRLLESSSIA